jgi:hypothetical protein
VSSIGVLPLDGAASSDVVISRAGIGNPAAYVLPPPLRLVQHRRVVSDWMFAHNKPAATNISTTAVQR